MRTALLPKEHGAYGQLAFPLVTAFGVCGVTTSALLAALAVVAGFLAHEPALVLLGQRGPRARRELARAAWRWLTALASATIVAGLLALVSAPPDVVWSYALPLAPAALLVAAIAARQEKSWHAEVAVALTFSLAAVPVCLGAGGTITHALRVAIPFALIFVAGTLAVRTVILRVRGGGDPLAVRRTRVWTLLFVALSMVTLGLAARRALLPAAVLLAAAPGLVLAVLVALMAVPATRLKTVGWSLVAASTITALIVIMVK